MADLNGLIGCQAKYNAYTASPWSIHSRWDCCIDSSEDDWCTRDALSGPLLEVLQKAVMINAPFKAKF